MWKTAERSIFYATLCTPLILKLHNSILTRFFLISSSTKQSPSQLLKQDTAERSEQFLTQLKSESLGVTV